MIIIPNTNDIYQIFFSIFANDSSSLVLQGMLVPCLMPKLDEAEQIGNAAEYNETTIALFLL